MGCGQMLALANDGLSVTPNWKDKMPDCQMHGLISIKGYIYATAQSGGNGLVCLELRTGKVMCNTNAIKQGVVIFADGMLYVYAEDGTMHLIKPNSKALEPMSRLTVSMGNDEHQAHPTIANGRVYIRHGDVPMA